MYSCSCKNLSVSVRSQLTSSTEVESRDPLEEFEEREWQEVRVVCLQHEYSSLRITEVAEQSRTKVEYEYPFLVSTDSHSQLTFLSSPTSASLSEQPPSDDVIFPCDVIFCINCRCPVFVIVINTQQSVQTLFATQFTKSSARLTPEDLVLESDERDLEIIEKIESLAFGLDGVREGDSEVLQNNLPPSLRIDWSKIQSKLRQLASEVAADIDAEKRAQIQRLTQLENEKASRRKSKTSSLFAIIEESISGLPRCATRHSSVSDAAAAQQLTTSGGFSQQNQINIVNRINAASRGEPKGLLDEMDQFGFEDNDDDDELGGKSSSGLVDDLNDEDEGYFVSSNVSDDEEAFLTESSGGSSSGIDAQNSSAMTSSQGAEIPGRVRSKTVHNTHLKTSKYDDDEDDFPILSQSVSQPIYIGGHSHRSASVALDDEQNKGSGGTRAHGGDLHLRMREISRSVRGDSSDIFGDLPDDNRRVDFAQIMRSYTNSSEGLFDINRDFTPSERK